MVFSVLAFCTLSARILQDAENELAFDPLTPSIPTGRDGGGARDIVLILKSRFDPDIIDKGITLLVVYGVHVNSQSLTCRPVVYSFVEINPLGQPS